MSIINPLTNNTNNMANSTNNMVIMPNNKIRNYWQTNLKKQKGLSLFELVIVLIIGLLVIAVFGKFYQSYRYDQLNLMLAQKADKQVMEANLASNDDIAISAGNGMGYFNGFDYGAARRLGGSIGLITPLRINERDAVSVLSSSPDYARLEILQATTAAGNVGTARVAANTFINDGSVTTSNGERLPQPGDLYLIVGGPAPTSTQATGDLSKIVADTRLVKILSTRQVNVSYSAETDTAMELSYDLCNGQCSEKIPGLINETATSANINNSTFNVNNTGLGIPIITTQSNSATRLVFEQGGVLVPLRMITLYYRNGQLVQNDGGAVVRQLGVLSVVGGREFSRASIDNFSLLYELSNGSVVNAASVVNLDQVLAIQVVTTQRPEVITAKNITLDRQIIRRLEIKPRLLEFFQ
jgi:hypothetical protein